MNCLIYSINEINRSIPYELLHAGMMIDEQNITANLTSLDDKILRKVIKKRVLLDANIVGGIEAIIPLSNVQPSFVEHYYTVYSVPPEETMNKEIISALSITFMPINGHYGPVGGYYNNNSNGIYSQTGVGSFNPVMSVADRIGNAAAPSGNLTNAHIEIVGYNTLLIYANYRTLASFGVRVLLENDSNLNNIQPRSYKSFSTLCVLATKAYLYNKLIIAINSGQLAGGQDLGMFKSILENYSSSDEDYNTYLREVWGSVSFHNDNTRMNRFIGSMLCPNL